MSIDLERETDPEILRQAAILLEAENRRLVARVTELTRALLAAQGNDRVALQIEIESLQAQLEKKNRMLFGQSSERRAGVDGAEPKARAPQTGHGPREQKELRIVVEKHVLEDADRVCIMCKGSLEEMGDQADETEEVDVVAREFVIKKHVRQKYRCKCGECIETAPAPRRLIAGGRYSLAFAVAVAVSKYADHLPLERQVRIMRREGLVVESQTLYDQIEALARVLWPAYDALGAELLEAPVVFADETPWPLLGKGAETARWHAWTVATPKGAYYEIHDTRGLEAGKSLLAGFKGIAVSDGYGVYDALEKRMPGLRLAQCWAHIRRKFVDCESAFPKEVEEILALIAELYAIEDRAPPGPEGDATRRQLRTTESRCVLARIQAWCVGVACTPGSALATAIEYMSRRWSKANLFLEHPEVPLDNNGAERALRGLVLGRKNHYGSKSRRGTEVAAVFYSLIESAKLANIEPAEYLQRAAEAALADPDAAPILPHAAAA
ncbi:MAG TPA: IS66 family transposase [Gemmatimonadaceae bacterium]|nr:IS66 family transposase [Gemmatimonadaceae bacterium]